MIKLNEANLDELRDWIRHVNTDNGQWHDRTVAEELAPIEAALLAATDNPELLPAALADIVVQAIAICDRRNHDLVIAINEKVRFNAVYGQGGARL